MVYAKRSGTAAIMNIGKTHNNTTILPSLISKKLVKIPLTIKSQTTKKLKTPFILQLYLRSQ